MNSNLKRLMVGGGILIVVVLAGVLLAPHIKYLFEYGGPAGNLGRLEGEFKQLGFKLDPKEMQSSDSPDEVANGLNAMRKSLGLAQNGYTEVFEPEPGAYAKLISNHPEIDQIVDELAGQKSLALKTNYDEGYFVLDPPTNSTRLIVRVQLGRFFMHIEKKQYAAAKADLLAASETIKKIQTLPGQGALSTSLSLEELFLEKVADASARYPRDKELASICLEAVQGLPKVPDFSALIQLEVYRLYWAAKRIDKLNADQIDTLNFGGLNKDAKPILMGPAGDGMAGRVLEVWKGVCDKVKGKEVDTELGIEIDNYYMAARKPNSAANYVLRSYDPYFEIAGRKIEHVRKVRAVTTEALQMLVGYHKTGKLTKPETKNIVTIKGNNFMVASHDVAFETCYLGLKNAPKTPITAKFAIDPIPGKFGQMLPKEKPIIPPGAKNAKRMTKAEAQKLLGAS